MVCNPCVNWLVQPWQFYALCVVSAFIFTDAGAQAVNHVLPVNHALAGSHKGNYSVGVRVQGEDLCAIVSDPEIFTPEDSVVLVNSAVADQLTQVEVRGDNV